MFNIVIAFYLTKELLYCDNFSIHVKEIHIRNQDVKKSLVSTSNLQRVDLKASDMSNAEVTFYSLLEAEQKMK